MGAQEGHMGPPHRIGGLGDWSGLSTREFHEPFRSGAELRCSLLIPALSAAYVDQRGTFR